MGRTGFAGRTRSFDGKAQSSDKAPALENLEEQKVQVSYAGTAASHVYDKTDLRSRLKLEYELRRNIERMILFPALFALLVLTNLTAMQTSAKRGTKTMLEKTFGLEDDALSGVSSLDEVTSFIKQVSTASKQFMALSTSNTPDQHELLFVGEQETFDTTRFVPKGTAEVLIDADEWTMAAWVRPTGEDYQHRTLLGQPLMMGDTEKWCWRWTFPPMLVYGAADRRIETEWEYSGTAKTGNMHIQLEPEEFPIHFQLRHYAVVVHNGRKVTFYENGNQSASIVMPRRVTGCRSQANLAVGDSELIMADFKFYPRALEVTELQDIVTGGQPLIELATGSSAKRIEVTAVNEQMSATEGLEFTAQSNWRALSDKADASDAVRLNSMIELAPLRAGSVDQAVNATIATDNELNLNYVPIVEDIAGIDSTQGSVSFSLIDEFSAYFSRSMTLTFWLRLDEDSSSDDNNPYKTVLEVDCSSAGLVSFAGFELSFQRTTGFYKLQSIRPQNHNGPWSNYKGTWRMSIPSASMLDTKIFRSHTLVFNEIPGQDRTSVKLYVDGKIMGAWDEDSQDWAGPSQLVVMLNLPNARQYEAKLVECMKKGSLRFPVASSSYRFRADIMLVRLYATAWDEGQALTHADNMMKPNRGGLAKQCQNYFQQSDSPTWKDASGKNCAWYASMFTTAPEICNKYSQVLSICPVACRVAGCQEARAILDRLEKVTFPGLKTINGSETGKFYVWDRIMHLSAPSPVSCVANDVTGACGWNSSWQLWNGLKLNFDAGGPLSESGIEGVTVTFWVRIQLSKQMLMHCGVLSETKCFEFEMISSEQEPTWQKIRLSAQANCSEVTCGTQTAVQMILKMEVANSANPDYASLPGGAKQFYWLNGRWNQVTIFFQNEEVIANCQQGYPCLDWSVNGVRVESFVTSQIDVAGRFLLFDQITVGSVAQSLSISPIRYSLGVSAHAMIATEYHLLSNQYAALLDPIYKDTARWTAIRSKLDTEINQPKRATILISPPVATQQRSQVEDCKDKYSERLFGTLDVLAYQGRCKLPYDCKDFSGSKFMRCNSGEDANDEHFGSKPVEFADSKVYAELLYTLDQAMLVRSSSETGKPATFLPANWLDTRTKMVSLVFIFYTPMESLATFLRIDFDTSGTVVAGEYSIRQFGGVTGSSYNKWRSYMIAFVVCLILLLLVILLDFFFSRRSPDPIHTRTLTNIWDLFLIVLLAIMAIVLFIEVQKRMDELSQLLDKISGIGWANKELNFSEKVSQYFSSMKTLFAFLRRTEVVDTLCMALLLVLLLRTVMCTSVHPRVALVTGTITAGWDDLKHFLIVFSIIYVCFALLATWTFGHAREDFGDVWSSLLAQVDLMLGGLPEGWNKTWKMLIYVISNLVVVFFLLLNFLLSIIVDAYMVHKDKVRADRFERGFFSDILLAAWAWYQSKRWKWPVYSDWACWLDSLPENSTVTLAQIAEFIGSQNMQSALAFDRLYFDKAKTEEEANDDEANDQDAKQDAKQDEELPEDAGTQHL